MPPPPPPSGAPGVAAGPKRTFAVNSGVTADAHRVVMYGPGGVGKTELASLLSQVGKRPLFIDLEEGSRFLSVTRLDPSPTTFDELRQVLQDEQLWEAFDTVVLDSLTKAEELATQWTFRNVPKNDRGELATSIESYGFGKGYTHVYESFLPLLGDLDAHIRKGRSVVCVAHECTANAPNPSGEDWIRFEPRLQSPTGGKASIRHRVKEWADHLLYIGFDVAVDRDGKAKGSGSRTVYPFELPTWWAKSRKLANPIPYYQGDAEVWRQMFSK